MRSSAPEGPIVPRAKQASPSGSSRTTACPAGGQPISQINRAPSATTKTTHSPQRKKSSCSTNKDTSRSLSQKSLLKSSTPQVQQSNKSSGATSIPGQNNQAIPSQSKVLHSTGGNLRQTSSKSRSKSPPALSVKHGTSPSAKTAGNKHPSSSSLAPNQANFGEYDDQEWDVGVGHLIIDLDADIAQADLGKMSSSSNSMNSSMEDKTSLKMKIKRTKPPTKTSEAKHVIVKSDSTPVGGNSVGQGIVSPATPQHNGSVARPTSESVNSNRTPVTSRNSFKKEKRRPEVNGAVNSSASNPSRTEAVANGPSSPDKESRPSTSNGTVTKKEYQKVSPGRNPQIAQSPLPPQLSATKQSIPLSVDKTNEPEDVSLPGPPKRIKVLEEKKDICIGTSVGTITEPDSLGPCEPGTAVTLGGIVWHETQGGILVVNVTWRGKSYVGTLLDCTKHDWAPPRLCDSPTSDMDSRNLKGRGKRGRTAAASSSTTSATTPEVNVAETRSGKTRNSIKGRRGGGAGQRSSTPNPPPSPAKQENASVKRKNCKDDSEYNKNIKKSRFSSSRSTPTNNSESSSPGPEQQSQSENDSETVPIPMPPSPKLIECPEPNCGKKYTHINGLKYHATHAHKEATSSEENELKERKRDIMPSSPTPVIEKPSDADISNIIKPSAIRPVQKAITVADMVPWNVCNSQNVIEIKKEDSCSMITNLIEKSNVKISDEVKCVFDNVKVSLSDEVPHHERLAISNENSMNSISPPVSESLPDKLLQNQVPLVHHVHPAVSIQHVENLSIVLPQEMVKDTGLQLQSDISSKIENTICQSPVDNLGSTQLASLPVSSILSASSSILEDQKSSPKDEINGVCVKKEEESSLGEARSPAYSDISEANDTAPSIEDLDSKDFKDDKKMDHSIAGPSQYAYGLYYNSYNQPPSQYMMSMPPSSPSMLKSTELLDGKDKERKEILQGNSDYSKIPPHYYYHYSQLYPSGYSNPYVRENVYSDEEKLKVEMKECPMDDTEKGPTDLSRSSSNPNTSRTIGQCEKSPLHLKDKSENCILKDMDAKMSLIDKRHQTDMGFRYSGPYDSRGSRLPSPHSSNISSVSASSPHHPGTVSPAMIKEDKCDKRQDGKPEGVKPTMETTGPPPPPTTSAYYPPFPYPHVPFDPYRQPIMPSLGLPSGFPHYNMSGHPSLGGIRYPMMPTAPEDLSRSTLPPGLYTHAHKFSELQERIQKSPIQPLGLPCSIAKSSSPMAFASKEAHMHHAALLSTSSPSLPISSNIPITSIAPLHHASVDRKVLPHMGLPEVYPYNIIPGAQFPHHFPPLGLNPAGLGVPPAMTSAQPPK